MGIGPACVVQEGEGPAAAMPTEAAAVEEGPALVVIGLLGPHL